jgi:hypothetical protein
MGDDSRFKRDDWVTMRQRILHLRVHVNEWRQATQT